MSPCVSSRVIGRVAASLREQGVDVISPRILDGTKPWRLGDLPFEEILQQSVESPVHQRAARDLAKVLGRKEWDALSIERSFSKNARDSGQVFFSTPLIISGDTDLFEIEGMRLNFSVNPVTAGKALGKGFRYDFLIVDGVSNENSPTSSILPIIVLPYNRSQTALSGKISALVGELNEEVVHDILHGIFDTFTRPGGRGLSPVIRREMRSVKSGLDGESTVSDAEVVLISLFELALEERYKNDPLRYDDVFGKACSVIHLIKGSEGAITNEEKWGWITGAFFLSLKAIPFTPQDYRTLVEGIASLGITHPIYGDRIDAERLEYYLEESGFRYYRPDAFCCPWALPKVKEVFGSLLDTYFSDCKGSGPVGELAL